MSDLDEEELKATRRLNGASKEIEVGEYVRIKEKGIIGKIEQIGVSLFWLEDGSAFNIKEKLYKHSKNIIDLIEVGDLVEVHNLKGDIFDFIVTIFDDKTMIDLKLAIESNELKLLSILTKEQYSQNCFRLEE